MTIAMIRCVRCLRRGQHSGRNLCKSCRTWAERNNLLDDYPRSQWSAQEVFEEVEFLRKQGVHTMSELARRLGLSARSVQRHLATVRKRSEECLTSRAS